MTELIVGLLLLVGAGGVGGAVAWRQHQQRQDHINHTRTRWVRAGRIVHYGPVGVVCVGTQPKDTYDKGLFGAAGLVNYSLEFTGQQNNIHDHSVPLDLIAWIGLRLVAVKTDESTTKKSGLVVHAEHPDGWRVYTFTGKAVVDLANAISEQTGLIIRRLESAREDYGPSVARQMLQDVYGEWTENRDDELYMAPDRLLFGWHGWVMLSQVRRLDVYFKGAWGRLNPFAHNLLRIEYQDEDGSHQVIGFELRDPEKWGSAIQQRTDVPLEIHEGRKKKESGL